MDVKINKIVNLFEKKLFKEALTEIENFFQEKSFLNEDSNKLAIIYNIKGLIYLSLDILNKSKESFIEATRLNPDFYPAFYNLGIKRLVILFNCWPFFLLNNLYEIYKF